MQEPLPDSMFEDDKFNNFLDPAMASKVRGKGKTPLHISLEAIHLYEKAKALAAPQDSVGVLFYNVDVSFLRETRLLMLKTLFSPIPDRQRWPTASGPRLFDGARFSTNPYDKSMWRRSNE